METSPRSRPSGPKCAALLGPMSSGKTTLLRTLAGLALPLEGRVEWNGVNIERSAAHFNQLAYLGHTPGLSGELTARENLDLFCCLQRDQAPPGEGQRFG